jgi:hypothetical protein
MAPGWWQKIKDGFGKVVSWVKEKAIPFVKEKIIPAAKKVWQTIKPIAAPALTSLGIPSQAIDVGIGTAEGITGALAGGDYGGAGSQAMQFVKGRPWEVGGVRSGGPAVGGLTFRK